MLIFQTLYILKNKKMSAISLVELIISIAIMAVLSTIIIINSKTVASYKEKIELDKFITTINQCKSKSIKERKTHKVTLIIPDNAYYSSLDSELNKFEYLKISGSGTNLDSIAFTVKGTPSKGSAGTIIIIGRELEYKITVSPVTGKINIKRDDANEE